MELTNTFDQQCKTRISSGRSETAERVSTVLTEFAGWLSGYGEASWDFQSFYAGPIGRRAKSLYYNRRMLGTAAVAPMVFFEALVPSARRLFHKPMRFPIADAHYAMGFAFLFQATGDAAYLECAVRFLRALERSRCPGFSEYCWGYPFDWVWRGGVIPSQTPLVTTLPYAYEAFLEVYKVAEPGECDNHYLSARSEWKLILESIARHAAFDIKDFPTSETASSSSYTPFGPGGVINAAAYRAFLLTSASKLLSNDEYGVSAGRNVNFVLENQNADGSWPYATDGVRDFVDHFHTCFVMKALAKIHALTGSENCADGLARGIEYYLTNLIDAKGLPKPFSKAPRLTVYKRELYDCAECINLCLLLRHQFRELESILGKVMQEVLNHWVKSDGSFRSRQLYLGWDNVPMHRWGQSQMFRSLALYLAEERKAPKCDSRDVADAMLTDGPLPIAAVAKSRQF
jgi:hypothetical protein